jgi:SOS-response transcriptional repressor LexA
MQSHLAASCCLQHLGCVDETLGQKVKRLRESLGMNQTQLALKAGLSSGYIPKMEIDAPGYTNPSTATLKRLSAALNVHPNELVDFGALMAEGAEPTHPLKEIPLLSGTVSASTFTLSFNDWEGETIGVPLKNIQNKVAWKISGRSMAPEIGDGDIVIIDSSVHFSDGDYVIAENSHGVTIKELRLLKDGGVELRPLNPDFPTICLKSDKGLEILGVVVGHYRDLRRRKK